MRARFPAVFLLAVLASAGIGCNATPAKSPRKSKAVYKRQTGSNLTNRFEVETSERVAAAAKKQAPPDYVPRRGFR